MCFEGIVNNVENALESEEVNDYSKGVPHYKEIDPFRSLVLCNKVTLDQIKNLVRHLPVMSVLF